MEFDVPQKYRGTLGGVPIASIIVEINDLPLIQQEDLLKSLFSQARIAKEKADILQELKKMPVDERKTFMKELIDTF
jgi:hypothetical protein